MYRPAAFQAGRTFQAAEKPGRRGKPGSDLNFCFLEIQVRLGIISVFPCALVFPPPETCGRLKCRQGGAFSKKWPILLARRRANIELR